MPVITYLKISLSENLIISFYFLRIFFFVDVILSHISTPNVSINGVKLTLRHSAKRGNQAGGISVLIKERLTSV